MLNSNSVGKGRRTALTYTQCEILDRDELSSKPKQPTKTITSPTPIEQSTSETMTLEKIKELNERNIALTRNDHVQDIYRQLQPDNNAHSDLPDSRMKIADMEKAKQILQQLNPAVTDTDSLLQALVDHISGNQVKLTQDMFDPAKTEKVYLPVGGPLASHAARQSLQQSEQSNPPANGFRASHSFLVKRSSGDTQEFIAAKVIESPEVLAVKDLLDSQECEDLITLAQNNFQPAKVSLMRVRVEEDILLFAIPDDLSNLGFSIDSSPMEYKQNQVARLSLEAYKDTEVYAFLRSVAARAAAVCKSPLSKVSDILIEKYEPMKGARSLHNSNKRKGTVIIGLSEGRGNGAISFPAASLEFNARQGMALFIPAVYPETIPKDDALTAEESGSDEKMTESDNDLSAKYVPDLRTEYGVTPPDESQILYLAVVHIDF